jgi:hypothetical protein
MKLNIDIEIDEAELDDIIRAVVIEKVRDRAKSWVTEKSITDAVKAGWDRGLTEMVDSEMTNCDALRAKVAAEMQRQLKNKLAAAVRVASARDAE